jgi:tetratricopeptide (TPR) repeat protein
MMTYDKLTTEELAAKAEQLEESGMLKEALEVWRVAIQRETDPVMLCEFASLAMKMEEWSEAEAALETAATLAPELPNPHTLLGFLYLERDRLEKAMSCFQQSLALEPSASVFTSLGVAQLELGLTEDARASLEQAIRIDPDYEEAYYNLGLSYRGTEPSRAIDLFEKAIEVDPEYASAHRELGWALSRLEGKDAEAEYQIRRSIELNDEDGWAHIYLGNILWQREDLTSAEQSFKKAVEVWSEIAVPYWCLALFYEHEGRKAEAERLYQQGLDLDPDDPQANKLFGIYLKDVGEPAKARAYLERARTLDPEDQSITEMLATVD